MTELGFDQPGPWGRLSGAASAYDISERMSQMSVAAHEFMGILGHKGGRVRADTLMPVSLASGGSPRNCVQSPSMQQCVHAISPPLDSPRNCVGSFYAAIAYYCLRILLFLRTDTVCVLFTSARIGEWAHLRVQVAATRNGCGKRCP